MFIFELGQSLVLPTMQKVWCWKLETNWTLQDNSLVCFSESKLMVKLRTLFDSSQSKSLWEAWTSQKMKNAGPALFEWVNLGALLVLLASNNLFFIKMWEVLPDCSRHVSDQTTLSHSGLSYPSVCWLCWWWCVLMHKSKSFEYYVVFSSTWGGVSPYTCSFSPQQ